MIIYQIPIALKYQKSSWQRFVHIIINYLVQKVTMFDFNILRYVTTEYDDTS